MAIKIPSFQSGGGQLVAPCRFFELENRWWKVQAEERLPLVLDYYLRPVFQRSWQAKLSRRSVVQNNPMQAWYVLVEHRKKWSRRIKTSFWIYVRTLFPPTLLLLQTPRSKWYLMYNQTPQNLHQFSQGLVYFGAVGWVFGDRAAVTGWGKVIGPIQSNPH